MKFVEKRQYKTKIIIFLAEKQKSFKNPFKRLVKETKKCYDISD